MVNLLPVVFSNNEIIRMVHISLLNSNQFSISPKIENQLKSTICCKWLCLPETSVISLKIQRFLRICYGLFLLYMNIGNKQIILHLGLRHVAKYFYIINHGLISFPNFQIWIDKISFSAEVFSVIFRRVHGNFFLNLRILYA